jgi:hypothetical protein
MKNEFQIQGEITKIFLKRRNGKIFETLISTESLNKVMEFPYTWGAHYESKGNRFYVFGNMMQSDGTQKTVKLHRWILDAPGRMVVDHINGDSLDNRLCNLRIATVSQNSQNRNGLDSSNTSGFRGVSWDKRHKKWYAYLTVNKKRIFLGRYDSKIQAAKIAFEARRKYMPFAAN